jgi:uncharacterized protein DUF6088
MRGPSLDLKQKILNRISTQAGSVWTPVDFLDLGARAAVDKALQRLAADGDVRRIDRGLYDRPSINTLTKKPAAPPTRAVIDAVSRRDKARLVVDGMTAANDLGLTTAIPAHVTVLTDARLRPIQLGAQTIQFKQGAPSRLYWAGRPAMRVVQALYWLQDTLPSNRQLILKQLRNVITHPDQGAEIALDLRMGLSAMPTWMQSVVRELLADFHPRVPSADIGDDADSDDDHYHHHNGDKGTSSL